MKSTLVKSKSSFKHFNTSDAVALIKMVVFGMGNLNLALRIEDVYKVIHLTHIYGGAVNGVGITHVGDREVIVVDLHRRLFPYSITNAASKGGYLIIAQNREGKLYGIPVAVVPALMEIPLSSIQVLPDAYRDADLLGFASHFCHIPQVETPLTIFLLNVEQLLPVA